MGRINLEDFFAALIYSVLRFKVFDGCSSRRKARRVFVDVDDADRR
jgi:hypothetical protein